LIAIDCKWISRRATVVGLFSRQTLSFAIEILEEPFHWHYFDVRQSTTSDYSIILKLILFFILPLMQNYKSHIRDLIEAKKDLGHFFEN